jgi:hypothetical protein
VSLDDFEFYDVALSCASEDRSYAEPIYCRLLETGAHIYYDDDNEATTWGRNLTEHLNGIYGTRARYCLMLVSANYARKMWTNYERKIALERAMSQRGTEYILPVKLDDTELEGLPTSVVYVPISKGETHIASLVTEKLNRTGQQLRRRAPE